MSVTLHLFIQFLLCCTEQKPNLQLITLLKYEITSPSGKVERKRIKLLEDISNSWKEMGQYLGMSQAVITGWECQHPRNYDRASAVLGQFLNNGSLKYACSWNGLLELVEDLGYSNVAKDFREGLLSCTELRLT